MRIYAEQGFSLVKAQSSMKPELILLVIKLTHQRDLRVSGHVRVQFCRTPCGRGAAHPLRAAEFPRLIGC